MTEARTWISNWLAQHGREHAATIDPSIDFVACGVIDSFATIQLIAEIEEEFAISFGTEDFQSPKFTTIEGMARVVERLNVANGDGGIKHG